MNRQTMFDVFKNAGLTQNVYHHDGGVYRVFEKPSNWVNMYLSIDKYFLIRGVESIILCTSEFVVTSRFGDMKVNIRYKDIMKLVVGAEEYE